MSDVPAIAPNGFQPAIDAIPHQGGSIDPETELAALSAQRNNLERTLLETPAGPDRIELEDKLTAVVTATTDIMRDDPLGQFANDYGTLERILKGLQKL